MSQKSLRLCSVNMVNHAIFRAYSVNVLAERVEEKNICASVSMMRLARRTSKRCDESLDESK